MSKILWTDETWNPITGCTKISPGCQNCYAERMSHRLKGRYGYPADDPFRVTVHESKLWEPYRWKKPRRIFVCSMGDLFHEDVGCHTLNYVFNVMVNNPQHIFQVLTKRPERMRHVMTRWNIADRKHIWLGVTAENQEQADKRLPILLSIPAAVRFVSVEPMLGTVSFRWLKINPRPSSTNEYDGLRDLSWVICGGESGQNARPMHPQWAASLRDQCEATGTPFMFKQWGAWYPGRKNQTGKVLSMYSDGRTCEFTKEAILAEERRSGIDHNHNGATIIQKVGKKAAGRLLDGRTWDGMPEVTP